MIFHDSSAGRQFSCNIIPYFFPKLEKMSQNLSSAAVVIGALRVNKDDMSRHMCFPTMWDFDMNTLR